MERSQFTKNCIDSVVKAIRENEPELRQMIACTETARQHDIARDYLVKTLGINDTEAGQVILEIKDHISNTLLKKCKSTVTLLDLA